ncbi:MAG TPA: RT0821/Lpp0805 family surface protein [Stellaceae bacterium]|nr:RT0821/Lpp0805 family surface protein [Stellaceae bacterium]
MQRLLPARLGLLIAAALLPACAGPHASNDMATTRPFAAKPLLRLASYEPGSKIDIVMQAEAEPTNPRRGLSADDQVAKVSALWHAVRTGAVGHPVPWSNADTGSHGFAEVMREVPIPDSDRVCREYREAFVIGGRSENDVGQACQLRDGSWWKIQG